MDTFPSVNAVTPVPILTVSENVDTPETPKLSSSV
jgi:hypothetical protein